MDDDEMEMTREELQRFIRYSVDRKLTVSENVRKKCNQLQNLLERKEKLSSDLIELFQTVSKCEAVVKQLYSKLGWEYEDPDSEGNKCTDSISNNGTTEDETYDVRSASSNDITAANSDEESSEETTEESSKAAVPKKELRVVLERLPMNLRPRRAPKRLVSDDELSNVDSDYLPSGGSSDSDFSITSNKSDKQKKKKLIKLDKSDKTEAKGTPVSQPAPVKSQMMPAPPVLSVQATRSDPATKGNNTNGASTSEATPNIKPEVKTEVKAEVKPSANSDQKKSREVTVGTKVFAQRKMIWENGTVGEIAEKEDGTKKYKIIFEDKGKMLVSGHHIAFCSLPKLLDLAVGGRVISKMKPDNTFFSPGILGELPSRKNHMRFLIFFDDQKTLYVALPVLRVVCKPLADPLDDIRDEEHKNFMKEYLQRMPYPPHTQFRVGQKIKVLRDEALQPCTVLQLDCSLMEVVYEADEEKEWIYRGSIRLEHIMNMKEQSKK